MDAFERLRETMAATLNVSPAAIRRTTAQHELGVWDSLGHINLMIAIESTFGITLEPEDFATLTSVPSILAYLDADGSAGPS